MDREGRFSWMSSISLAMAMVFVFCAASIPTAAQSPSTVGQWSAVVNWPVEAIHLNVLPNGKVMVWGPYSGTNTPPYIWDPVAEPTGACSFPFNVTSCPGWVVGPLAPYAGFCSGHVFLANGQLLVLGGLVLPGIHGAPDTRSYDYTTNAWTDLPDMNDGRYYPTATTLPSGNVLILSGNGSTGLNTLPQIWNVATSSWTNLTSAVLSLPLYPKMFVSPAGTVFYAGPTPATRFLTTTGTGSWGKPIMTADSPVVRDYGPAVMYDAGKILLVGGARPPVATAETIDLNAATPAWKMTPTPMANPRRQNNATILADGTILVTGGSSGNNTQFDDYTNPVLPAELWNPATQTWSTMASFTRYRGYHSTAALLPDGRVISAGGDKSCANQGVSPCNLPNAEIYSPPYLFQGARPTITSAPASVTYGQTFFVQTPDATNISTITWIRLSTVTHTFNENQRINYLNFTQAAGGLNVTAPANSNLAPPGHYMLFILKNGVPSVASIVQIQ